MDVGLLIIGGIILAVGLGLRVWLFNRRGR